MVDKSKFNSNNSYQLFKNNHFCYFSILVVQIMGKHIQLRYMIRLNSMYSYIFRLIYHKIILNVLREVVRSYAF